MKSSRSSFVFVIFIIIVSLFINLSEGLRIDLGFYKLDIPSFNLQRVIGRDFSLKQGLDLEGGTSITLRASMDEIAEDQRDDALDSATSIIEKRVNFFGVSEPLVQTSKASGDYRIIVEIPGVTDVDQAVSLIGQTAKLSFWEAGPEGESFDASESAKIATNPAELIRIASESGKPLGAVQIFGERAKQTNLTGSDLKKSSVIFDQNTGNPQVGLEFTSEGGKKFADITERNVGKIIAILIDEELATAPSVNEPIFGGNAVINGDFTRDEANKLSVQLNAGALPVSLSVLQERTIGATLGDKSVDKSLVAGVVGLIVVVIFMIFIYGRLGVVASLALLVYTIVLLAVFRIVPVTLTLAGIAGVILSVGVAVDANILIFERMKEEVGRGRSLDSAVDVGFSRAWPSIRDSNAASLIISTILYYFGTTIVKGFALTLALGVIVSMFSAIMVTRTFLRVFYQRK